MNPEYYSWNGVPVEVEVFDARETDGWDVTGIMNPEHDTGRIPDGEIHYLVTLPHLNASGWWVEGADLFWEYAKPLSPNAIERYEERDT